MQTNLTLTAHRWQLAPELQRSRVFGGVLIVKNIPAGTYLEVTREQWHVLEKFYEARTVPPVLQEIIEDRTCPALSEFYELILKAVRAHILVEPQRPVPGRPVANWPVSVRPAFFRQLLWTIFLLGSAGILARPPAIPGSVGDVFISVGLTVLAWFLGSALSATLLRGAGGEVYVTQGIFLRMNDARMISPADQRCVALGLLAVMASTGAGLAWYRPAWAFVPMVFLILLVRPILGGVVPQMFRAGASSRLSAAEHSFIFPPNRTARRRIKTLGRALRSNVTWLQVGYGVAWTLALTYLLGASSSMPPWKPAFWKAQGVNLGLTVAGSLLLLGLIYLGSELYLVVRDRAFARRDTFKLWYQRWLDRSRFSTDESARLRVVIRSPLLRTLPPQAQLAIATALKVYSARPWKILKNFDEPDTKVSLIRSGKVGVYRRLPSGRRELAQVLCENDIVGLHSIADSKYPVFLYRTLTPVVLLELDRASANTLILDTVGPVDISIPVQKLPFLSRIDLCQNWHMQAIQRFVELSKLFDYKEGDVILRQGFYSESFYIVFEGEAKIVTNSGHVRGKLGRADFFGEIGLLQNSNATSNVVAGKNTRCLGIPRQEFLRFVAHNYTVALTLERVSSRRLGRPIFPLVPGDFDQL